MHKSEQFDALRHFDDAPDSMLISIKTAGAISTRSRASVYRHIKAGELPLVKIGNSSRIRVGDLRKLIGVEKGGAK